MTVKLINNNGSGSVASSSPFNYSYSEDVTSLEPSSSDGGTGQIVVSAIAVSGDKVGNTHPDSKLLINNSMSLVHSESGELEFFVKKVDINEGRATITGDSVAARLNVERTAEPHGGEGSSLLTAILYYCELVGISLDNGNLSFDAGVDTLMDDVPVNFIGWTGNVWEHLKMLAAAVPLSTEDNIGFEFYINNNALTFREAKSTTLEIARNAVLSSSIEVDAFDAAQEIDIYSYKTEYAVNRIIQDVSLDKSKLPTKARNSFTNDSFQVSAGETVKKRVTINASLDTINQPAAVDEISPFPYPEVGEMGQYAIAGGDGIFIKADQWIGEGGSLTVALTENPLEIEITVTAPPKNGLENINGGGQLSYEPYKIAVESSGSEDYPALYITGTGVFYQKRLNTIKTGAPDAYTSKEKAATIDNPFIINDNLLYTRGVAAAQAVCGPKIILNEELGSYEPFGSTPGAVRSLDSNNYRVVSVDYSESRTGIVAMPCASFDDFNAKWTGLTLQDFDNTALDPDDFPNEAMKFNEFTVIPLMEPEVL